MPKTAKTYCTPKDLESERKALTDLRRHIHQHPELSHKEVETARLVAEKLKSFGYEVTEGVGGTGVVGRLKVGSGTKRIGIRADMDALPIMEETGLPYASKNAGVMHACGHDGHTTILLGAAKQIAAKKNFSGTLNLIFQPAEEAGIDCGAKRMLKDGLFERFPCDAIFGLHNHPGKPEKTFHFRAGPMMSASDRVTITVKGRGGHAARPHMTVDPIVAVSSIVMALQTIVARNVDPTKVAVVTVGTIQAGKAMNVIANEATIGLSVRSFDADVRELLKRRIIDLAQTQAASFGASAEVDYGWGHPVLVNSEAETAFAREVAAELVGDENVGTIDIVTGSEDFAYMLEQVPGSFVRLGNGAGEKVPFVHTSRYDFNDENLTVGAAYWTRLVERYLE
ncbi:MAG TPA: M20 aminoacylase family protein [Burkholderiales bacterium]|nr:M20 aminoacylase family protein [Burkholderiales bacterium]